MIENLISKISFRSRDLLVDFGQMTKVLKVFDELDVLWKHRVFMGNCGWAKAPDCWYIHLSCSDSMWYSILRRLKEEEVELLPETTGY